MVAHPGRLTDQIGRVGHFVQGIGAGTGIGEATAALIAGLRDVGVDQVLITHRPVTLPIDLKIPIRDVRTLGMGSLEYPILRPHHALDVDVLVIHGGWHLTPAAAAAWARRLMLRYVVVTHGAYHARIFARHRIRKSVWMAAIESSYLRGSMAIQCCFEGEYSDLMDKIGQPLPPGLFVTNAVQRPPVSWQGQESDYLLWMGRFDVELKGLDLLVHALSLLPATERPTLRLHGEGPASGKVETQNLANRFDVQDWVEIGGLLKGDQKWQALSQAKAYVFPSRWEGFGMALAEAVGAGVPTLSTDVPLANYLGSRGAVHVVQPDAVSIADGLRFIVSEDAKVLGPIGQRIIASEFMPAAIARTWIAEVSKLTT